MIIFLLGAFLPAVALTATSTTALECLRFSAPDRNPSQFIVNYCNKPVFVAVIEFQSETVTKHCAVYGLQGGLYANRYAPGEYYERESMYVSLESDHALQHCRLSGYPLTGTGLGDFVHFQKKRKKKTP